MSTVVVDTDVVSYLFKSDPIAFQHLPDLTDRIPIISFMTLAELARRKRLREYLEHFLVSPYGRDLCMKWAEVTIAAQACGITHAAQADLSPERNATLGMKKSLTEKVLARNYGGIGRPVGDANLVSPETRRARFPRAMMDLTIGLGLAKDGEPLSGYGRPLQVRLAQAGPRSQHRDSTSADAAAALQLQACTRPPKKAGGG